MALSGHSIPFRRAGALAFLALGFSSVLLSAMPARGETLLEAYKLALQFDPKFKAAQAEARAAGTLIDQARAGFLPTVKFEAEHIDTRQRILSSNNPIFGAGVSTFPTSGYTLSVAQALFRLDVIERYSQAESIVRQANFTVLAAEQELILRSTSAYLSVLAGNDAVALAVAERQAVRSALEVARERLKGGLGTITNLHDASARYAVAQAREIEAQNRLADARQALREIVGKLFVNLQVLREAFALLTPDPPVVEQWVEAALQNNLLLQARREAVEVARQEVARQRAGYVPQLNLLVNHNRRDAGSTLFGGGSTTETTDVILRLTVPLFEGGLTTAVTREASFRYQKALEEQELERRGVERLTRAAFQGVISGLGLMEALRESVASQQSALAAKQEAFKAGLLTLLPVLDAQRDLFLVRRDYEQARYDYLFNRLRLKQAAGTLSEADLEGVAAALQ